MTGFGFIEYDDPLDARDVVHGKLVLRVIISCIALTDNFLEYRMIPCAMSKEQQL